MADSGTFLSGGWAQSEPQSVRSNSLTWFPNKMLKQMSGSSQWMPSDWLLSRMPRGTPKSIWYWQQRNDPQLQLQLLEPLPVAVAGVIQGHFPAHKPTQSTFLLHLRVQPLCHKMLKNLMEVFFLKSGAPAIEQFRQRGFCAPEPLLLQPLLQPLLLPRPFQTPQV